MIVQPVPIQQQAANRDATQYRPANIASDVAVPAALSGITGIAAVIGYAWLWWMWPDRWPDFPLECALPVFLITAGAMWYWRMRHHDDTLIALTERAEAQRDAAAKAQQIETTYATMIEVTQRQAGTDRIFYMGRIPPPIRDEIAVQFARAALNNLSLAERQWAGSGKPMTSGESGEYRTVKRRMMDATPALLGYVTVSGRQRLVATAEGRQVFEQFVAEYERKAGRTGEPADDGDE